MSASFKCTCQRLERVSDENQRLRPASRHLKVVQVLKIDANACRSLDISISCDVPSDG